MSKLRLVTFLGFGLFSCLLLLSNKNGRASQSQRGNTGAPGDETQGGQPKTCIACHNGPIQTSLAITVLDSANNSVTQYKPGQLYTARVTITASGSGLNGYGFQMIGLRDSNNSDLDGFTDINPNNYKIATIPGGRTYAEHSNISATNTFDVRWTAPVSGTGPITLYAAGNGVNSNGSTSGDGAGFSTLKLTEFSSAALEPASTLSNLGVYPNPVRSESVLQGHNPQAGEYQISAFNVSGEKVWLSKQILPEGEFTFPISSTNWHPGIYFIYLERAGRVACVKVLKL